LGDGRSAAGVELIDLVARPEGWRIARPIRHC
jgi:hypothetical protein